MVIFQPDRYLLQKFVSKHASAFNGNVLDIGGGSGRYKGYFSHVGNYKNLDPDETVKPDIHASVEQVPLNDSSVDCIICTQVLGDVWNLQQAVSEIKRILKPGGLLLVTEALHAELHDEPYDYWRFTPHTYKKLFEDAFDIIELEPRGGYYSQAAQQKIRHKIEKYNLYQRPFLGRIAHIWALTIGKVAIMKDNWDNSPANHKFTIGYCILARKK